MLSIRAFKGYDFRDEPDGLRGAHGLTFVLVTTGEFAGVRYASQLDISTLWMARPLAGRYFPGRPQERRRAPGLDELARFDPSASLHLCIPVERAPEDWSRGGASEDCPWLGVPCASTAGYSLGDDGLRVLLDSGEEGLEAWLHESAADWLKTWEVVA